MNNILKAALRLNSLRSVFNPARNLRPSSIQSKQLARNLWYMCSSKDESKVKFVKPVAPCTCGFGSRSAHSKAEKELVEFLTEEVLAERKAQKVKTIPTEIDGFKAQLNGAEVTLTKNIDNETIKITFNVNHSVDTDNEPELHPETDKPEIGELKSKPDFKIDLVKNNTTISIVCSFVTFEQTEYNDIFGIDEVCIYNGEWHENAYTVSGDVLDSYLYDLLLNYLEEKGISNEFVEKLSQYSTAYEHSAYISLLEGLSKYISEK